MGVASLTPIERRDHSRAEVSREVTLQLPAGLRHGYLLDLSRSGAQIEIAPQPAAGSPVLMRWDGHEAFGEVVWARGEACGVRFDKLLPEEIVGSTAAQPRIKAGPTASVANIPLGARRSSRLLFGPEQSQPDRQAQ